MKTNEKQIKLLLVAVIVVIIFAAYRFGYQPYMEKTEALNAEAKNYKAQISILNAKILRLDTYKEGIATSSDKCFEILNSYGGGNTPEKSIMFIDALEREANMTVGNVTFGTDTALYYTNKLESTTGLGIYLFKQPLTINFQVDYAGLKKAMDYINSYPQRMNVENITLSYETMTGQLTGTMIINLYSVIGGKNEYTEPSTGVDKFGTGNIFGTVETNGVTPNGQGAN